MTEHSNICSLRETSSSSTCVCLDILILTSKIAREDSKEVAITKNTMVVLEKLGIEKEEFTKLMENPKSRSILMSVLAHELTMPYKVKFRLVLWYKKTLNEPINHLAISSRPEYQEVFWSLHQWYQDEFLKTRK